MPSAGVGYHQQGADIAELTTVQASAEVGADALFGATTIRTDTLTLTATPVAFAPLRMTADDGRVSHFPRALCDVATDDGRTGTGWLEWNLVQHP